MKPSNLPTSKSQKILSGSRRPIGTRRVPLAACASALAAVALAPGAKASNFYWTGLGSTEAWNSVVAGSSNWSTAANTVADPGAGPGSGDDVIFTFSPENNANATTLGQDFSIKGLTFVSGLGSPVVIGGANLLTIGADGITVASGSASNVINSNVAVGTSEIWANDSGSATSLTFGGNVSGNSALTLEGTGSVLTPSGTFAFTGASSYSGALTLLNDNTALTLSGAGTLNSVSSIALGGGTTLTLDNGASAASRLGSGVNVTAKGAVINVLGNAGATTDAIGTLNLSTGATTINATGASTTFTVGGLTRSVGGVVAFNPTAGATIATTGITNNSYGGQAASIIGGYAVFGTITGSAYVASDTSSINWATVSGSNIAALGTYGSTLAAGVNAQIKNATQTLAAGTTHVNSVYLAGTGASAEATSIAFGANTNTLIVDSGGIISSGGTDTYSFNGQSYLMTHANSIGNNNFNGNSGGAFDEAGSITSGTGDLSIYTANGSSLRLGMYIVNNGSGAVGLTKNGNGILDLSQGNNQTKASNSYTGITTINGGILFINNETQLGVDPTVFVPNQLTFNGGDLRSSAGIALVANRGITVGPQGGTISYAGGGSFVAGSVITGPGGISFAAIAGGTSNADQMQIQLVNATYQGPTTVESTNQSFVELTANNPLPTTTALTVTHGTSLGNPTATGSTTANTFFLNGHNLTVGSLSGEGALANAGGTNATLSVGSNNVSTIYTGILGGAAATGTNVTASTNFSLVKTGTGNLTLTAANLYTLGTTINGGGIIVNNSTGSGTGTGAVTVTSAGTTGGVLGGTGIVTGSVTAASGGTIAPTVSGTAFSTLRLNGGLTLNTGSILSFNLGTPNAFATTVNTSPTSDNIFVGGTGVLSIPSTSETINLSAVNIPGTVLTGTPAVYQLITDPNGVPTISGTTFHINGPSLYSYSVAQDSANDSIDLTVIKNPNPSLKWVGFPTPGSGTWDIGTTAAWNQTGVGQTTYSDGANLTFDNSPGAATTVVALNTTVQPGSMTFNNNAGVSYVFNGSGSIAGSTGFVTQNNGTITFNTVNTATGAANLTNGTVIVGATGALANSSYTIAPTANLTVNGSLTGAGASIANAGVFTLNTGGSVASTTSLLQSGAGQANVNESVTFASVNGPATSSIQIAAGKKLTVAGTSQIDSLISGTGHLGVSGGVVTLSNGSNSYGTTGVTGGTLLVTNTSGSATGSGAVHVFTGGTLDGTGSVAGAVTIDAGATLQGTGTFGSTGGVTLAGNLSPAGAGTIGTINLGATTISSGANLNFDFGSLGVGNSDFANIVGTLNLSGTDIVNIDPLAGFNAGTYTLATASSIIGSATFTPVVNNAGPGFNPLFNYAVSVNSLTKSIVLNVTFPTITWTGSSSNNWNFTDQNWSSGTQLYTDGNQALFTDTGTNTSVVLDANIAPQGGVAFNNNSVNYTFASDSNSPNGIGGAGGVVLNGSGSVAFTSSLTNTYSGGTTINKGTLTVAADYNLGAVPATPTAGSVTIGDGGTLATSGSFTLNANRGIAVGGTGGVGATISVAGTTTLVYTGVVANITGQTGILNKSGAGELDLSGANTFSGGFNINAGAVKLTTNASAGGTGAISVSNAVLDVGTGAANNINLNGGATIGNNGTSETLTGNVTVTGNNIIDTYSAISGASNADLILTTGMLQGSGNLVVQNVQGNAPDGTGLRLRNLVSTGANEFSGTITLNQSTKFELQTNGQTTGSQLGTGTVIMNAGAFAGGQNGTFALWNIRNNSSAAVTLGNNVVINGTAGNFALINLVAPSAGSVLNGTAVNLGTLTIGDAGLGVGATNGVTPQQLTFTSVSLTASNAVFAPTPASETGYNTAEILTLGAISDSGSTNPNGSGITLFGNGTLNLSAVNNYRGGTTVNTTVSTFTSTGTVNLGVSGALPANTPLTVNAGTLSFNNGLASNDQTVSSLSGAGGTITNSDPSDVHTLNIAQSTPTTFSGAISGNLNLAKSGSGSLGLNGAVTSVGTVGITGGSVTFGAGSSVGALTASGGATLGVGSGTAAAGLTTTNLTLATGNLSLLIGGTTSGSAGSIGAAGAQGTYSQIFVINGGTATLGGNLSLALTPAYATAAAVGDTQFIIEGASSLTGTFANLGHDAFTGTPDIEVGNIWFDVSYNANAALGEFTAPGGTDVALTVVAVPEPGSFATILSGLGMLVGLQRFRRRS